jgi:hypothetical protein
MIPDQISEDPLDWEKPKPADRSYTLTWWMTGLAMGIFLLAANLANNAGYWPDTIIVAGRLQYATYGLVIFGIYSAGAVVITRLLRQSEPEMPSWQIAIYGLWSGLLAAVIFAFIKIVGQWLEPVRLNILRELALALVVGTYCAAAAWGWAAATKDRHWWVGVLVLAAWIAGSVFVMQRLNLGMEW